MLGHFWDETHLVIRYIAWKITSLNRPSIEVKKPLVITKRVPTPKIPQASTVSDVFERFSCSTSIFGLKTHRWLNGLEPPCGLIQKWDIPQVIAETHPSLIKKCEKKNIILLRICENHHVAGEKHPLMSTVNPGEDYLSSSTAGLIFPPFPEQGLRLATF